MMTEKELREIEGEQMLAIIGSSSAQMYIVHAAVPALVAEVRRLQEVLKMKQDYIDNQLEA